MALAENLKGTVAAAAAACLGTARSLPAYIMVSRSVSSSSSSSLAHAQIKDYLERTHICGEQSFRHAPREAAEGSENSSRSSRWNGDHRSDFERALSVRVRLRRTTPTEHPCEHGDRPRTRAHHPPNRTLIRQVRAASRARCRHASAPPVPRRAGAARFRPLHSDDAAARPHEIAARSSRPPTNGCFPPTAEPDLIA